MDRVACEKWIERYFHPGGLKCPHCDAPFEQGLWFRRTELSDLDVYRCRNCKGIYNLYSGTIFEGRYFTPEQTVLFIRGVCQGKPTAKLARELGISRTTATEVRRLLRYANAEGSAKDNLRDNNLEAVGWNVLRFTTSQIQESTETYCIKKVNKTINTLGGIDDGNLIPRKINTDPDSSYQLRLFGDL